MKRVLPIEQERQIISSNPTIRVFNLLSPSKNFHCIPMLWSADVGVLNDQVYRRRCCVGMEVTAAVFCAMKAAVFTPV